MATYPTGTVSFTPKTDGVEDVLASHMNAVQNEVQAIEVELGTLVKGPSTNLKTRLTKIDEDTEGADWTDYSATSTITGWVSFTLKQIWFKKIGKLVFVQFVIQGESNSVNTSFTLPYNQQASVLMGKPIFSINNGVNGVGYMELPVSSNLVSCFSSIAGAAWTASGTKDIRGEFIYRLA